MSNLSISKAWEEATVIVRRDGRLLASVAAALIVLPQAILVVVGLPFGPQATLASKLVYLAVIVIGLAAQIALNRLAIGPSVTVARAIREGFVRLIPVLAAVAGLIVALVVILMLVGAILGAAGAMTPPGASQPVPPALIMILLILMALSFAVCQLFIPVAAAERGGPIHLYSRSWELARGNYLRLLAFVIMVFIGLIVLALTTQFVFGSFIVVALGQPKPWTAAALALGLAAGIVQGAFTVICAVTLARIYVQLSARGAASVPKSGI